MKTTNRIMEILLRYEELKEQGRPVSVEELCSSCPELIEDVRTRLERLQKLAPLFAVKDCGIKSPGYFTNGLAPEIANASQPAPGRYRRVRLHARGGIGEVYLAEDTELNRRVALKQLQPLIQDSTSHRRFSREAEITSQLEHPGIVPIYGLVEDEEGRPSYAMRFIEGESLRDAIHQFHQENWSIRCSSDRILALRRLLAHFVSACNTIAYAHDRDVVHRDLKPANIMLGKFGETIVVDWGLAKKISQKKTVAQRNTEPPSDLFRLSDLDTKKGEAPGTPAFMSPEQAAGAVDQVGPASDIFSLGATLYSLLSGRPPFESTGTKYELLQQVAKGNVVPLGNHDPSIPAPLRAICLKALGRLPDQRYPTALALAADVERWLAGEPVAAYCEPLTARMERFAKRHRGVLISLSAVILFAILIGFGAWWWQTHNQAREHIDLAKRAQRMLHHAKILHAKSRNTPPPPREKSLEARILAQQVQTLLRDKPGHKDLKQQTAQLLNKLEQEATSGKLQRQLDDIHLLDVQGKDAYFDLPRLEKSYESVFKSLHALDVLSAKPAEAIAALKSARLSTHLAAALDHWGFLQQHHKNDGNRCKHLLDIAKGLDEDGFRNRVRAALASKKAGALEAILADKDLPNATPASVVVIADCLVQHQRSQEAICLLEKARLRYPDSFLVNQKLGILLQLNAPGRRRDALPYFTAATSLRPDHAMAWYYLGLTFEKLGKQPEAVAALRRTVHLEPKHAKARRALAASLQKSGQPKEAVKVLKSFLNDNGKDAEVWLDLGGLFMELDQKTDATSAFEKAMSLDGSLVKAHFKLATICAGQKNYARAEKVLRDLSAREKNNHTVYFHLASILRQQKKDGEASLLLKKSLQIKPDFVEAHVSIGNIQAKKGQADAAKKSYETAIKHNKNYAPAHMNLGAFLLKRKKLPEAVAALRLALKHKNAYAEAHCQLGHAFKQQKQFDEALKSYQRGHELGKKRRVWRYPTERWIQETSQYCDIQQKMSAYLRGDFEPPPQDLTAWASYCLIHERKHYTAARLYDKAFSRNPKLLQDATQTHCRFAARAAAVVAGGKATEGAKIKAAEKNQWRKKALVWLRHDLRHLQQLHNKGDQSTRASLLRAVNFLQKGSDLKGLRARQEMQKLSKAEQQEWTTYWNEIRQFAKKVREEAKSK